MVTHEGAPAQLTVGDLAQLMERALGSIEVRKRELAGEEATLFSFPSFIAGNAVSEGDATTEEAVHTLNLALLTNEDLGKFAAAHPEAASVPVGQYVSPDALVQLFPDQAVRFLPEGETNEPPSLPGTTEAADALDIDTEDKWQKLTEKYPLLTDFFDDIYAVPYKGKRYYLRKHIEDVMVCTRADTDIGRLLLPEERLLEKYVWAKYAKWRDIRSKQGKTFGFKLEDSHQPIVLAREEMIDYLWFIDCQEDRENPKKGLTYAFREPAESNKKK